MAVKLKSSSNNPLLEVHATDHFTEKDYQELGDAAAQLLSQLDSIRVLLVLTEFHGWETDSLWERGKLANRFGRQINRLAIVGDVSLRELVITMGRSWKHTTVRFFAEELEDDARTWLSEK